MPTSIQIPGITARLADAFKIQGSHILLLDENVVPVVLVADVRLPLPSDPIDATFVMFVPGPVAAFATALLENSSEGLLFLVDEITISTGVDSLWQILLTTTAPTNPIAGGAADKTWNNPLQTPDVSGTMFADSGAFIGPDIWKGRILANTPTVIRPKLVLPPGHMVGITNLATAEEIRAVLNVRVVPS